MIFDRDVLAFAIAGFLQTLPKGRYAVGVDFWSPEVDQSDHRHRRLLRPRRQRPRRRAAEQRDDLAPTHHSITSSARASSVGGTSRPSALAVLRLISSSNLVGCSIG